jgi:hypothetical protein
MKHQWPVPRVAGISRKQVMNPINPLMLLRKVRQMLDSRPAGATALQG